MKLIVGLGNSGQEYANTRHNAGYLLVDKLQELKLPKSVIVRKTDTFMNESGVFVKKLANQYKLKTPDLYIVHDDLDLPIGNYKIQFGKGPKDHNGVASVDAELGTNEYWHIRIGVDNRPLDNRPMGEEYVLQDFTGKEREILDRVIREVCHKILTDQYDK